MYNHSSFSCQIVKFQLRMFKFVFVLQVIVGPLAVVSCDTLCLLFIQKTKTVKCCSWLTSITKRQKKHENSVRLCNGNKVLVLKYINIKKNKGLLNSFCSSILLQLKNSNFWEFWYFQGGGTFVSKLPTFKTLFAFVQTSRSRGQHLCSKFAKIPHLGCPRTFKVPTLSRGPPPRA